MSKNPKKKNEIVNIQEENLHLFWNKMKNFNEIFRNDMTYDNIKTQGPIVSLKNTFFEKPQGSGQIDLIPYHL